MASVMEMPKLSDTMKEGAIARWMKKEGEKVSAGLEVVEIETDKATMEYQATSSGILLKILVGDGQTCEINAPIAVIGKEGENWEEALKAHAAKKKGGSAPAAASPAPVAAPSASSAPVAAAPAPTSDASNRVKASPLARKIAADLGVDLSLVKGSGPNGRVVQRDLDGAQPAASALVASATAPVAEFEKLPVSMMRKTIARRLTESVQQAPHFYLTVSIHMGPVLEWRKQAVAKLPEDQKFSVNDLVIFLVARALKRHPNINSSWQGDFIAQYRKVHMGFAVALPTGLITPVVRDADSLSITDIAQKTRQLIKLAKDGKLQPEDYAGGTFTISNLGMAGIDEFTAIINPPQAAILAVGATVATPVVDAKGAVVVEQRMRVTLSSDHRVIDGAQGAEFLKTLKSFFEDPMAAFFFGG